MAETTTPNISQLKKFLTLPGEELLFVKRKHFLMPLAPLTLLFMLGTLLLSSIILGESLLNTPLFLIMSSILTFLGIVLAIATKILVDWYFHLYAVTTHKLLEICYTPLFSKATNDVLLDQVKCTEIDIKTDGMVKQLLDIGSIIVTFDRPTHQEEFTLSNIKDSQKLGMSLGNALLHPDTRFAQQEVWFRSRNDPGQFRFTEEIVPTPVFNI